MNRRDFVSGFGMGLGSLSARPPVRLSARGGEGEGRFIERWSWAMGQPVHLMLYADSDDAGYEAAGAALAELRRVETRLSLFDDASDLCELNRRAGLGPLRVGGDLTQVLTAALEVSRYTGGAFNPAVEPLMCAWGFHRPRITEPTAAEIAEARDAVTAAVIRLEGRTVTLATAHTQIDLGGIAVGYGLDRAMEVLRGRGIRRAFLDVSGDCYALGAPPGESGWGVAIADSASPGTVIAETSLRDAALATSANTVSVIRYGARLRGHVMNPASGYPAEALRQVTVVAKNGIAADALSTAMLVSGTRFDGVLYSWTA